MKRHLLPLLFAVLLSSLPAAAKDLVIYSPHGADIRDDFADAFEKAHPGTSVKWLDMGAAEVLERVRAEAAHPGAQVWWGAPATFFDLAAREGLLEPYRPTWADSVPDYARGEGDHWYGQFDLPIGIGYVPGRIPDDALPESWDDLVRDGAAGRLLIRDPPASGTMKTFLAAMIARQPDTDAGFEWLARLDARTAGYTASPNLLFQKLARGEGDLTVWNVTDLLFQKARYGYPFEVILPAEGVPVITDSIALVKGAGPLARAFYEFVTSVEANLLLAKDHFRLPTRRDLPPDRLPEWSRDLRYRLLDVDKERMAKGMESWTVRWENEVRNGAPGRPDSTLSFLIPMVVAFVVVGTVLLLRARKVAHEDV